MSQREKMVEQEVNENQWRGEEYANWIQFFLGLHVLIRFEALHSLVLWSEFLFLLFS